MVSVCLLPVVILVAGIYLAEQEKIKEYSRPHWQKWIAYDPCDPSDPSPPLGFLFVPTFSFTISDNQKQ